ncbi:Uma2 family endonuclease [Oscillatoria salina]|uniref:Uma2 family endonuclease n=1 Tax=Oscillatoria salina TaxID=331517 RepID=UPI0013B8BE47|nr:Uma2 family endonuclease [Oscillatoria salina]MBZ8183272.1 Uma2 family endonuclease [Oscillatoria salina IIICB1]NET89240.1 Uma2 family endonuclease [Kamptonema sp. SIO1D9]
MILLNDLSQVLQANDPEEKRIITGVNWHEYETFISNVADNSNYRIAYLDKVLEIVSPSRRHESEKTRIGTLLEAYFLETDIEYFPTGSTTFRKEIQQAGAEPDESYCLETEKDFPDLVIEVIITSGGINRLQLYQRLGIREVWFWQNDTFSIYHLQEETPDILRETFGYELINNSQVLPDLDINLLSECVRNPSPLAAVKEFRQRWRRT